MSVHRVLSAHARTAAAYERSNVLRQMLKETSAMLRVTQPYRAQPVVAPPSTDVIMSTKAMSFLSREYRESRKGQVMYRVRNLGRQEGMVGRLSTFMPCCCPVLPECWQKSVFAHQSCYNRRVENGLTPPPTGRSKITTWPAGQQGKRSWWLEGEGRVGCPSLPHGSMPSPTQKLLAWMKGGCAAAGATSHPVSTPGMYASQRRHDSGRMGQEEQCVLKVFSRGI